MDTKNLQIGKRMKALRAVMGWTQADLAAELGVTVRTISSYECGADPRWSTVQKLINLEDCVNGAGVVDINNDAT